jgi:hypothetical protein
MSEKQSSLTTPTDQVQTEYVPVTHPSLNDEETAAAMEDLSVNGLLSKYGKVERRYADPSIPGQAYSLHSWIPAKGASPNEDGIFGMIKIRGTFSSVQEMNERAEDLIRNHDSYHKIYHGFVGKPMPLTLKSDWSKEVEEVDVQKAVSKTVSDRVKEERSQERKQVQEIRARERNIREAVEEEATDPYEKYTCLRVKKAQVIWGFMEHSKKVEEFREVFARTLEEVAEYDAEKPEYAEQYLGRYMEARERAGIPEDRNDTSFMKYLNHDVNDLDAYLAEQKRLEAESLEQGEDANYKTSRAAGSTITVERVERPLVKEKPESVTEESAKKDD